jgi:hypothetical protein
MNSGDAYAPGTAAAGGREGSRAATAPARATQPTRSPCTQASAFRSTWFTFPTENFLSDNDPDAPDVTIGLDAGEAPVHIVAGHGQVELRKGVAPAPDLTLAGEPRLIRACSWASSPWKTPAPPACRPPVTPLSLPAPAAPRRPDPQFTPARATATKADPGRA